MINFAIKDFALSDANGVAADFKVAFQDHWVDGLSLCRRNEDRQVVFMRIPKTAYDASKLAVRMSPRLYGAILAKVVELYTAETGEQLTIERREESRPRVVESEMAGLRRVIGETCDRAGI